MPTAIRVIDRLSDLADYPSFTIVPLASPTSAQEVFLGSRPPAANSVSAGFNMLQTSFANSGGGDESNRRNEQWRFGYNASAIFPSHDKSGEPMLYWTIESFYNPGAGSKNIETYLTYVNKTNTFNMRPFSFNAILTTDQTDTLIAGSIVHLVDNAGADVLTTGTGNIRIVNGAVLTNEVNNTAFARQLNGAANAYIEVARINDLNQLVLAFNCADVKWPKANVALGGGAAPTLGTIGGSGPATASQNSWLRVIDSTGAACWLPVWK